jgi:hypothetical protein
MMARPTTAMPKKGLPNQWQGGRIVVDEAQDISEPREVNEEAGNLGKWWIVIGAGARPWTRPTR